MTVSNFTVRYVPYVWPHDVELKLCMNPNYGGKPCDVPGACVIALPKAGIKPKFNAAMEEDIAEHGFRNPILLYNTEQGLLLQFGGSRLKVAKRLGMHVPAIVVDYYGTFATHLKVTPDNWASFFTDVPTYFEFTDFGVLTHYSLERNRRKEYDAAGMAWAADVEDDTFLDEEFPWLNDYDTDIHR